MANKALAKISQPAVLPEHFTRMLNEFVYFMLVTASCSEAGSSKEEKAQLFAWKNKLQILFLFFIFLVNCSTLGV